ncbi:lig_chan-Glu_bd domain-containing protein [Caerostris extrusa]|uniref:Lig_chan-Glu_bd domain-containing protein n=1 Tax=Caerostris extrusa TaxID=172846 RepID=A0AAV4N077_CAEEX|nr:lig_chan-Glu_bd domain-containing protein [Caerostris extrusa]
MKLNSKITVAVNPSIQYLLFNLSADGTIHYSVFEGKFLEVVMKALGLPYNLVFPEDGLVGDEISPGNWTGMMGIIQRDEADLAYTHLPINEQRNKLVDFSRFYSMEEYVFVFTISRSKKKSPLTLFLSFQN